VKLNLSTRWLDIAVKVVAVFVVAALVYLGYTVWSNERAKTENSVTGRAIENLIQVVKDKPRDPGARILLAQAFASAGKLDDAVEQFQNALKLDEGSTTALEGLGLIAMKRGEWRTAEGYWRRIIENLKGGQYASQDQRLERAYYYLGLTLIEVKDYENSVLFLKEALRMKRDAADTHYAISVAYRELGSLSNQRKELETALSFIPTLPEANYDMGLLLLADDDLAGAAELFRRSVDNAPGRAEPMEALAELGPFSERLAKAKELEKGDAKAALVEARIAIALEPTNLESARLVASLLDGLGNKADAIAAYERVLSLVPSDTVSVEAIERLDK